uniref:C1q-domain-containing protein-1 n=1 Tax=Mytilus coruscus TaxID=42192 RepID=A0A0K2D811_MYTCO|nr:C1q-domain-containing protein-1 [Mytilus coruscus]
MVGMTFIILAVFILTSITVSGNPVGFHANRGSTIFLDTARDQTVVYDKVITNVGNGYNSRTGIFTCPKGGLYSFSWTSLTPPGKRFETRFILNRNRITGNRANAESINQYVQATKNVVVEMKEGDTAKINTIGGAANVLHGDYNSFSSFSGFKVADLIISKK